MQAIIIYIKIQELEITLIEKDIHTSGHASEELIERVKEIVEPKDFYLLFVLSLLSVPCIYLVLIYVSFLH